jgi:integrase
MRVKLKHVKKVRAKGKVYFYHTKTGQRLPDDPEERARWVLEINAGLNQTRPDQRAGTVGHTIKAYLSSPEFNQLAPGSKKGYRNALDTIRDHWGKFRIEQPERKHVMALRDKYSDKPGKANTLLRILGVLFRFAVDRGLRADNPTRGVPRLKQGEGHKPWTEDAIAQFLQSAPEDMCDALLLGLYTGQRRGDVQRMSWADYDGQGINVRQQKTGARLWIPVHPKLKAMLDAKERVSPLILTRSGKPMTDATIRHRWSKAVQAAGLDGHTFHGLRYTATANLFEAGATPQEAAAITGHKSLAMLEKYGRSAQQKLLAQSAIKKLTVNVD